MQIHVLPQQMTQDGTLKIQLMLFTATASSPATTSNICNQTVNLHAYPAKVVAKHANMLQLVNNNKSNYLLDKNS
ncbi:hypothetical protein HRJ35_12180 [Shewanella oneidensis MR-1]|uniref:hypothetical protein n=1 Tax=Shewanella oneidensis TaxID=70863 RepID=UPI0013E8DF4C|nr:hypothetical protein [Shewanella oneidensis]MDX5996178.1 hypothetical protein [Shewanella oneidensis]QKG96696.1 hypothetical protein HRJ35_12180 [Shewanella oneidensis MR-1]